MKLRKVLSLIIAIAMIMTASTAFAFSDVDVENDAYEAITALSALNILTGYEDGTFLPEGKVTRAEFATIIMRAKGYNVATTTNTIFDDVKADHWASGAIAEAFGAAIVNGRVLNYDANGNVIGGTFDPEAEVTYEEATKMIVNALGYEQMAQSMVKPGVNPYPTAYNLIANQKGITNDVAKTAGGASRATIARLVWNALPVNLFNQYSWGDDNNFSEDDSKSLLYTNLDAVLVEAKLGTVELDPKKEEITFAWDGTYSDDEIDDVAAYNNFNESNFTTVKKGACDVSNLQGLKVKALVSIADKYDPELIAIFPATSNRTLEVIPSLFQGFGTADANGAQAIKYYKDFNATTVNESSKIESGLVGYVNDYPLTAASLTVNDITDLSDNPGNALYRFVDTNNNGYYDTLYVDNYASFVVKAVDVEDNNIMGENVDSNMFPSATDFDLGDYDYDLTLDPEDDTLAWTMVDEEGKEITIADVNVGDVITYSMAKDATYKRYDIVVLKASSITGTVTGSKTDKRTGKTMYAIDGEYYFLNLATGALELGATGTFQLTADGKIISCELDATARNFGVAINVASSAGNGFSNAVTVQLMDATGAVQEIAFADEFYNNQDTTKTTITTSNAATEASSLKSALTGKVVMYELNSDGAIKKIYYDTGIRTKDSAYQVKSISGQYKESSEKIGNVYFDAESAIVACEAAAFNNEKKDYSFIGMDSFVDEESYTGTAVVDADGVAVMAALNNFVVLPSYGSAPIYVTEKGTVSVNGESRVQISGYVNGEAATYTLAEDVDYVVMNGTTKALSAQPINVGDAIQFTVNGSDEIAAYRHLVQITYVDDDGDDANDDGKKDSDGTTDATPKVRGVKFMVSASQSSADQDNKNTATSNMQEVAMSLEALANSSALGTSGVGYTAVSTGSATNGAGYAAFGRVQRVSGKNVGIFTNVGDATGESYFDVYADTALPLYVSTDSVLDGYEVKALGSIKTYISKNKQYDKTDDLVYIFRYDGETVFQYAIDQLADNN